ncbi:MAG: LamG-like jellyroll fold domain-containing protein [bacterium]|nr:LamG-like jellyroll fold domain-containing protein [bacterium]
MIKEKGKDSRFYRDFDERTKTLRTYGVHVLQREEVKKKGRSPLILVFLVLFLAVSFATVFFFPSSFTGFAFLGSENIVSFSLQEGWNLSDGFVRISQNLSVYDIFNLSSYAQDTTLSFDLDNYNLSDGYVYVDLILNETLVDSEYVYYQRQYISLEEEIIKEVFVAENVSITVVEETVLVQEENAGILNTQAGFYVGNSTGTYQVDHVLVENEMPYSSNTFALSCTNGSTSTDVSSLLYLWYVNGSTLRLQNQSSLATGNVSAHDKIECGILPQKGSSLVAYWPFDEGSGTEFHEFVNNFSGSSNKSNWSIGRNYYAIAPNGTNNFTVGNTASLNLTKNFTIEMWISAREAATMEIYHLDVFRIHISGGNLQMDFPLGENGSSQKIISTGSFPLNSWKHVAFTYDNTTLSLYIDGVLDNSTNVSGRLGNYSGVLYFGKNDASSSTHFRGLIDEIAVYNASLNVAEIRDQYKKGIALLSRHNTLEIETTQAQFGNGTCNLVNCSIESGNISLLNVSSIAYYVNGNFTSQLLSLPNGHDDPILRWSNTSPAGTNLSLQVRTGVQGDNETINWGEYSGPDPTHFKATDIIIGVDFSEGKGNTSSTLGALALQANLSNNDFTPFGKHGYGVRMYGENGIAINGVSTALRLSSPKNYSIELWVKPINNNSGIALFSKGQYTMYTNASGTLIFNVSYDDGITRSTEGASSLLLENWTHIVVTRDADNTTRLYVNGSLEKTAITNGSIETGTNSITLGSGAGLDLLNGTLDSFVIYNRTLSAVEIFSHAQDRFTNSTGGEYTGELNRFIQYRAFFESNKSDRTPTLYDVSFRFFNYSAYIYNNNTRNVSLSSQSNNSLQTSNNVTLNWTRAVDFENDTVFYEFLFANDSNFTNVLVSTLAINNMTQVDYSDDNNTIFVEHFELKETLRNHEFIGNWTNTQSYGKWGNGFELKNNGQFLRTLRPVLNGAMGTIEFWVRPNWNGNDGATNYFIEHANDKFALNRSGSLLYLSMDTNSSVILTYNITNWNANEWHHIGISWQRNKNLSLYLDGVRVNRTVGPNLTSGVTGEILYIGSNASFRSGNIILNGTLDELRISNVARESSIDLNSTNFTLTLGDYADNTYYWRARATQLVNESLDGESSNSIWNSRAIRLDTRLPTIISLDDPVAVYWDNTTSLNVTSSEPAYCEYKNHSGSYVPMEFTSGLSHGQLLNLSSAAGNYTYFINCNDTANQFVNTTLSFYVFNRSASVLGINTTNYSFVANTATALNFTDSNGINFSTVKITTNNNISAKISVVMHSAILNPENTSTNLEYEIVNFWTIIPDDFLVANLSGNATVTLFYRSAAVETHHSPTFKLFRFNYKTSEWVVQTETTDKDRLSITFSTKNFGTYTLSQEPPAPAKKKILSDDGGKAKGAASDKKEIAKEPYIDFHEDEYLIYEFPFLYLYADVEESIEMNDPNVALFSGYFASNSDLENIIIYVQGADPEEAYNRFSVFSSTIDTSQLSYLTLEYTVEKFWLEENGYTVDDLVFVDGEGTLYQIYSVEEDEEYYYLQSDVNLFGTFTISTQTLYEESITALSSETKNAEEESEIEENGILAPLKEILSSPIQKSFFFIFVYAILFSLLIYYFAKTGASFYNRIRNKEVSPEEVPEDMNLGILKRYVYLYQDREHLREALTHQGWKETDIEKMSLGIRKLPQGQFESYIYKRLCLGNSEEDILQDLAKVGWDTMKIQKEIERFRNI